MVQVRRGDSGSGKKPTAQENLGNHTVQGDLPVQGDLRNRKVKVLPAGKTNRVTTHSGRSTKTFKVTDINKSPKKVQVLAKHTSKCRTYITT